MYINLYIYSFNVTAVQSVLDVFYRGQIIMSSLNWEWDMDEA